MYPSSFYEEIFRLRGLSLDPKSVKRPQYFGGIANNIVYDRMSPDIREELKKVASKDGSGRPTANLFQKLTKHKEYLKLLEHLSSVVTIMKLSDDWKDFMSKLDRIHPICSEEQHPFSLDYKPEEDDGKEL